MAHLVWNKLTLATNSLFDFLKEYTVIINSPSCCAVDAWTTLNLSHHVGSKEKNKQLSKATMVWELGF